MGPRVPLRFSVALPRNRLRHLESLNRPQRPQHPHVVGLTDPRTLVARLAPAEATSEASRPLPVVSSPTLCPLAVGSAHAPTPRRG